MSINKILRSGLLYGCSLGASITATQGCASERAITKQNNGNNQPQTEEEEGGDIGGSGSRRGSTNKKHQNYKNKYKALKSDLLAKSIEFEESLKLTNTKFNAIENEKNKLAEDIKALNSKIIKLEEDKLALETKLSTSNPDMNVDNKKIDELEKAIESLKSEKAILENSLKEKTEEIVNLNNTANTPSHVEIVEIIVEVPVEKNVEVPVEKIVEVIKTIEIPIVQNAPKIEEMVNNIKEQNEYYAQTEELYENGNNNPEENDAAPKVVKNIIYDPHYEAIQTHTITEFLIYQEIPDETTLQENATLKQELSKKNGEFEELKKNLGWCFKYRAPNIVDNRNFFAY